MSWRLPFATCKLPTNVTLTVASVLLLSVHSGIFVSDLYHFAISQRFDLMSFPSTTVLLVWGPQSPGGFDPGQMQSPVRTRH